MAAANVFGGDAWYASSGLDDDVFVFSKICLARNLSDFPFPSKLRGNDGDKIHSLVLDAFNCLERSDLYQSISVNRLDSLGSKILLEREILEESSQERGAGLVVRSDGKLSCSINICDHLRISSFAPGFDLNSPMGMAFAVDKGLQKKLQFAASYDFGYLTSMVDEAGSGVRFCVRMHLPSLSALGKIPSLAREYNEGCLSFSSSFGSGGGDFFSTSSTGSSLGAYYDLKTRNSLEGTEQDQLVTIVSAATKIRDMERASRSECLKTMESSVKNSVFRSIALSRASIFVSLRESISIISSVKWGIDLGILEGIDDRCVRALLYRIQQGHLEFVLLSGKFNFESDIKNDTEKKIQRLRSVVLQEAFEKIKATSRKNQ